mgnify:CR=1 FL=1
MNKYFALASLFLISGLFVNTSTLDAQVPAYPQPPILINTPTAGALARGSYATELRMMPEGGVLAGVGIGLTDRFMIGVSYGGTHIIGQDSVEWNPQPGVQVKYRFIEETYKLPAFAIGFNSQGYHRYIKERNRYTLKSTGFYAVASKNYQFLGNLGLHVGINYSLENETDDDPNLFAGIDKAINEELSLMVEYDTAINDNERGDTAISRRRGYLNAAIRWTFAEKFHIELDMNNLLRNKERVDNISREIKIVYIEYF